MLQRALEKAKRGDDKKVNINFQVPSLLKEEFEKLCKESGVSVTAMLNSLMEVAIEENRGIEITGQDTLKLIEELNQAQESLNELQRMISNGEDIIVATDGTVIDCHAEVDVASAKITAITAELKKKGKK